MKHKWIKKGDRVLVISGNDRGKVGEVIAKKDTRILVQGINIRKRHMKSRDQSRKSDIISIERPIHISNVALCDADGKKLKLKAKFDKDGSKKLIQIDNDKEESYRTLRNPT